MKPEIESTPELEIALSRISERIPFPDESELICAGHCCGIEDALDAVRPLVQCLLELAQEPYPDSDAASLLATLRARARDVLGITPTLKL